MLVKDIMTRKVTTVQTDATVAEVRQLLAASDFRRVPVMEGEQLVGIVDAHRLVGEGPVKHCMVRDPVTTHPDMCIEEAARVMADNKVSALPVLEDGRLVGIITQTDLFRAAVDALGARQRGVRVTLRVPETIGMLADITNAITKAGGNFISLVTFTTPDPTTELLVMKVRDLTQQDLEDILSDLSVEVLDIRTV
ncbi:MAG: CBS domain-containing protein [Chloroflexi bacterium]|nr:CBS domain-containing protein [Chloroflexota bacterium]